MRVCFLDLDGTLLGPGGSLFAGRGGAFSNGAADALRLLRTHAVHSVLVSGRTRPQLVEAARILGADAVIPELGATETGRPAAALTLAETIERSGVIDELIAHADGGLQRVVRPGIVREATVLLVGRAPEGAAELVTQASQGRLRLADNGAVGPDGVRSWHVGPVEAGKGPAVAAYLATVGARAADALAVGNSREDAEMATAGVRVALVGNVRDDDPDLAAAAPWVTRGHFGAGVAEAVRTWLGAD